MGGVLMPLFFLGSRGVNPGYDDVRCGLITAAIWLLRDRFWPGAELILMVGTLKHEQSY